MAMTRLQIEQQVLRMEGQSNEPTTELRTEIQTHINDSYIELHSEKPWYWMLTSTTQAISYGSTSITLGSNTAFVLAVKDGTGACLEPRDAMQQIEYSTELSQEGIYSYSNSGTDATGNVLLKLEPAAPSAATYTIHYAQLPTTMSTDSSSTIGPYEVGTYVVWATRLKRLLCDEEREGQVGMCERQLEKVRRVLEVKQAGMCKAMPRSLAIARG